MGSLAHFAGLWRNQVGSLWIALWCWCQPGGPYPMECQDIAIFIVVLCLVGPLLCFVKNMLGSVLVYSTVKHFVWLFCVVVLCVQMYVSLDFRTIEGHPWWSMLRNMEENDEGTAAQSWGRVGPVFLWVILGAEGCYCHVNSLQYRFPGEWLLVCLAFPSLWMFSAYERHWRVGHDQRMGDQGIFMTNVIALVIACLLYSTKHEECSNHVFNMGHYYLVNVPWFWVHNNASSRSSWVANLNSFQRLMVILKRRFWMWHLFYCSLNFQFKKSGCEILCMSFYMSQ